MQMERLQRCSRCSAWRVQHATPRQQHAVCKALPGGLPPARPAVRAVAHAHLRASAALTTWYRCGLAARGRRAGHCSARARRLAAWAGPGRQDTASQPAAPASAPAPDSSSSRSGGASSDSRSQPATQQRTCVAEPSSNGSSRNSSAASTGISSNAAASSSGRGQVDAGAGVLVEVSGRRRRRYVVAAGAAAAHAGQAGASASGAVAGGGGARGAGGGELTLAGEEQLTREEVALTLVDALKRFALPRGFPGSVTSDYLAYQLWTIPAHITGWLSISLTTSSLLKAVGVSAGAAGATAAGAAIKWITKDGIGALGRLLVGGRLGNVFDEDPKRWRMVAEAFATLGLSLEISTSFFPGNFLLLAGLGNFTKALGRGMGKPAFRIIQTHFAVSANVGDIAAKEEVWEVGAQLTGLALSVAVLHALEGTTHPQRILWIWAAVQAAHVGLRWKSLSTVELPTLNHKRASLLVRAHVAGEALPGVAEGNAREAPLILLPPALLRPHVRLGVTVEEAASTSDSAQPWSPAAAGQIHSGSRGQASPAGDHPSSNGAHPSGGSSRAADESYDGEPAGLAALWRAHADVGWAHVLVWRGRRGAVLLRDGATQQDALPALWQAAWLEQQGVHTASLADAEASLAALAARFPSFLAEAEAAGWDVGTVLVPLGPTRISGSL